MTARKRKKPELPGIAKALAYLKAHPGATPYAAAKHADIPRTGLYAYLRRQKAIKARCCPTCGKPL